MKKNVFAILICFCCCICFGQTACSSFVKVSAGIQHSLGIKNDGTLWAWGYNNHGQLGDGTTNSRATPVKIGVGTNWLSVSAGGEYSLGVKSDGTLWAWGYNEYGELGCGLSIGQSLVPIQIGTDTNWLSVSTQFLHSLGVKTNGTLWAWGWNNYSQLGDGTTVQRNTPVQIGTSTNWVSLDAGEIHSIGLKNDGSVWGWGENGGGQLGDNSTVDKSIPVQALTTSIFTSVSAGYDHTLAIKNNGTLWAWGSNGFGKLGDGTSTRKTIPVQVGNSTWISVSAGVYHSLGVKSDGTLWAWGSNQYGQIGDGSGLDKNIPVQIGSSSNWVSVSAGRYHSFGIKSDGSLWAWGRNFDKQLGDGTATDRAVPVQISVPATSISIQPVSAITNDGGNVGFSLTALGNGLSYQWQVSTNGGSSYTNLSNAGVYSNATSPSLVITNANYSMNNYKYRCIVTGSCSVTSSEVSLTVNCVGPVIVSQPISQSVCFGSNATFTITASGTGISYQWKKGTTNINGATSSTLTLNNVALSDAGNYSCMVTGNCGSVTSDSSTLNVNQLIINATNISACGSYTWPINGQTYTAAGTYSYVNGCHTEVLNLTMACPSVVNLKLNLEGYYDTGMHAMRPVQANQGVGNSTADVDTMLIELRNTTGVLVNSTTAMLHTDGTATAVFTATPSGNYYLVLKHRNAIQTWSATPQVINETPLTYDFTTAASKAYGNNMKQLEPGVYGLYSGDINQDGFIEGLDYDQLLLDSDNLEEGNKTTDLNGDGFVEGLDYDYLLLNSDNLIESSHP